MNTQKKWQENHVDKVCALAVNSLRNRNATKGRERERERKKEESGGKQQVL